MATTGLIRVAIPDTEEEDKTAPGTAMATTSACPTTDVTACIDPPKRICLVEFVATLAVAVTDPIASRNRSMPLDTTESAVSNPLTGCIVTVVDERVELAVNASDTYLVIDVAASTTERLDMSPAAMRIAVLVLATTALAASMAAAEWTTPTTLCNVAEALRPTWVARLVVASSLTTTEADRAPVAATTFVVLTATVAVASNSATATRIATEVSAIVALAERVDVVSCSSSRSAVLATLAPAVSPTIACLIALADSVVVAEALRLAAATWDPSTVGAYVKSAEAVNASD